MEPDLNKIIREKIRNAEQKNIPWQRDETWLRIRREILTSKTGPSFYLIAASVISILLVFTWMIQQYQNKKLSHKIEMLAEAIDEYNAKQDHVQMNSAYEQMPCSEEASAKINDDHITVITKENKNIPTTEQHQTNTLVHTLNILSEMEKNTTEEFQITIAQVPEEILAVKSERVHPIIGVFEDEVTESLVTPQEKKTKLRFKRSNMRDAIAGGDHDNKIIIARIH